MGLVSLDDSIEIAKILATPNCNHRLLGFILGVRWKEPQKTISHADMKSSKVNHLGAALSIVEEIVHRRVVRIHPMNRRVDIGFEYENGVRGPIRDFAELS